MCAEWHTQNRNNDNSEFEAANAFELDTELTITYMSAGDTGVDDHYPVKLVGSPLAAVPNESGSWRVRTDLDSPDKRAAFDAYPWPRRRTYFLSRTHGEVLE